ncbi:MAG: addiction module protein [Bacteroidales bacterium]|nr:addiction module protein [Bacteroidales bacterium]MCF8458073.1 addiction module protein [Bacteroidales bacterium]
MNLTEIKNMSPEERLRTMESLWDVMLQDETGIEPPDWHEEILSERKRKIENGTAKFISIDTLKKRQRL